MAPPSFLENVSMQSLRTPDDRFVDLADYPFAAHYVEIDDLDGGTLRAHYLDEGPADAAPILLMHGEPSWSYLYRSMIPALVAAGHRCIAPDLIGFGRSDKPTERSDYTYARHEQWMTQVLFGHLDLRNITFFGQDWGGLIGLRLVANEPDRYDRVVIGNTGLPTGEQPLGPGFAQWLEFSQNVPELPVGGILNGGSVRTLSEAEIAAYDAPFPDESYKAGARAFPVLVPGSPDDPGGVDNRQRWTSLARFDKPFLCAFSDQDAVTRGGERAFIDGVAGAAGQPHTTIVGGGHFLQEDCGPELAQLIIDFIARTR
jgi:haloalkane dehalogenase